MGDVGEIFGEYCGLRIVQRMCRSDNIIVVLLLFNVSKFAKKVHEFHEKFLKIISWIFREISDFFTNLGSFVQKW